MSYSSTLSSFAFLLRIAPVFSILVNRTIDDERGDSLTGQKPLYTPEDQWHQGATCSVCLVNPSTLDTSQIFDTTWHDGTYDLGGEDFTVQANFTGTAVYVFNIIPNTVSGATTLTNLTFTLDGDFVGQFTHTPDATADVTYRAPVYTNTTLSNSEHSLIMRAGGLNASLILFDYIVYTAETTSTSSSSTSSSSATSTTAPSHSFTRVPVGAIVGAAVGGGVMLLALIIAHVFFSRRRRKRPRGPRPRSILTTGKPEPDDIDPEEMRQHVPEDDHPSTPLIGSSVAGSLSANVSAVDQPRTLSLWGAQPVDQASSRATDVAPSPSPTIISPPPITPKRAEILENIHALENKMEAMSPARSTIPRSGSRRKKSVDRPEMLALRQELASLRDELAGLSARLADDPRVVPPAPPYGLDGGGPHQ